MHTLNAGLSWQRLFSRTIYRVRA